MTTSTLPPAVAPTQPRTARRAPLAGAVVGTLAFLAYLPGRGRSLDFDSAVTVGRFIRQGPPWMAFREQAVLNNHPMFSFLEQLVRVVTGRSDAATMRLLPILCGALAVGVLVWFTARRHGLAAGIAAGAVLACNPAFVHLSRSVRGYSLLTLCALVATIVVVEDRGDRRRRLGPFYVVAAAVGLATHLYMAPVVAAHVGAVVARRGLDDRWRRRFLWSVGLAGCAYAAMAGYMLHASGVHGRDFQADMPWRVATMATGGGWASLVLAPLVVVGAWAVLRGSRSARGAAIALVVVLAGWWAVLQPAALEARFFVWLVPGVAYLVGVAVGTVRARALAVAGAAVLAVGTVIPGYTADPTGYRAAAAVLVDVHAAGGRGCVVGTIGAPPIRAYLDDFTEVTDPSALVGCDVVVAAAWWPTTEKWFAADRHVIDAAIVRFDYHTVLEAPDAALVLSDRPLTEWTG